MSNKKLEASFYEICRKEERLKVQLSSGGLSDIEAIVIKSEIEKLGREADFLFNVLLPSEKNSYQLESEINDAIDEFSSINEELILLYQQDVLDFDSINEILIEMRELKSSILLKEKDVGKFHIKDEMVILTYRDYQKSVGLA